VSFVPVVHTMFTVHDAIAPSCNWHNFNSRS